MQGLFELVAPADVGRPQREFRRSVHLLQAAERGGNRLSRPVEGIDAGAGLSERLHPDRPEFAQSAGDDRDFPVQTKKIHQATCFQDSAPLRMSKEMAWSC